MDLGGNKLNIIWIDPLRNGLSNYYSAGRRTDQIENILVDIGQIA